MTAPPTSAPMNASDLLPCPFCGGVAEYFSRDEAVLRAHWTSHEIQCTQCRSRSSDLVKDDAIAKWNTRASARAPSGVDRREEVARIIDVEAFNDDRPTWHDRREKARSKADAIFALLNAPQWEPIETAPKDGTKFMAFDSRTQTPWFVYWDGAKLHPNRPTLTHWRPLPAPPSAIPSYVLGGGDHA